MTFTRTKIIKGISYAYLVESYRDDSGKIKQRVIKYLGRLDKVKKGLK